MKFPWCEADKKWIHAWEKLTAVDLCGEELIWIFNLQKEQTYKIL